MDTQGHPSLGGEPEPDGVRSGSSVFPLAAPAPPTAPPPRARRRWPWVVVVVVLLATTAVAAVAAWDQRETAALWQERAGDLELQRDDAIGRTEALQAQLDEVAGGLAVSEQDVAMLEERIRELADEKAQAEDTATTVQVERDVFLDLSTRIVDATAALDTCVDRLFDLHAASVDAFNRSGAGEDVDVGPLNESARQTTDFCNTARTAAAQASAAAQQLAGP